MDAINLRRNDSPKLYFGFTDVYGKPFSPPYSDLTELTYSVYQIMQGRRVPIEGFTNVTIPESCWHAEPGAYPKHVRGVSGSKLAEGYTLELYPFRVDEASGAWISPFTEPATTYQVVVKLVYPMTDEALEGTFKYKRDYVVSIVTGN